MIFSVFYKGTGLLLGVRMAVEMDAFCYAIVRDRSSSAMLSPAARRAALRGGACKPLSGGQQAEMARAISSIWLHLRNGRRERLSRRVEWLARFAGYPVKRGVIISEPAVSEEFSPKLTAYLLCLFLALRGQSGGGLIADAEVRFDKGLVLEWQGNGKWEGGTEVDPVAFAEDPAFSFLRRDCFRCFRLMRTARGLCLRIRVTPEAHRLRGQTENRVMTLIISGVKET